MNFFRFKSLGLGIYEAIEKNCPPLDSRRSGKPDGSWLPKVGGLFPNSISFWTEYGLDQYNKSGLETWHLKILRENVDVLILNQVPKTIYYKDKFQIITNKELELYCISLPYLQFLKKIQDKKEEYHDFIFP